MEVVRGPATLMYGSAAIGGVVNVLDSRIPTALPDNLLTGSVDFGIGSVAKERRGAVSLGGKFGPLAWHGDASKVYARDYKIPGFARNPPEPHVSFLKDVAPLPGRNVSFGVRASF
jgi:iron complex outermembrane receptor protein